MTPSEKSKKLTKADVLALLNPPTTKPELDVPETPSSPIPGPDTPNILSSGRLTKDEIKKLEDRSTKLIKKRKRLEADIDAESQLLSGGRPAPAASPVWSKNMEALQGRLERLSAKETKHMADLTTKFGLVTGEYMQKETSKKRRAMERMGKIYERFHDHLGQHGIDNETNMKNENESTEITKKEEASDQDEAMAAEGHETDNEDGKDAEMSVQEQFERATRHMNLDEYDETEIPSDIEEAITRSASKSAINPIMRGFTPLNPSFMPFHSHSTADHGFNFGMEDGDDPFLDEQKPDNTKSKKDRKKEKKRKRESVPDETTAERSDDEHETPKKKKKGKGKTEVKKDPEDTQHEDSDHEDSPKKAKKAKKSNKEQGSTALPANRRYSTSIIPLPFVPPHGIVSPARPVAHASPTSKHSASPTAGPPVPIAPPVAPNSGRRPSMGAWSIPKKRMFSSIRDSPPPVMGGATTPEPTKQWVLEGGAASRARAKSTSKAAGTVTMTIGAHPPVRPAREASPAEAASQKRRPGRPKGSKTQNKKAIIAGEPPLVSTTPIPLPVYASRAHNEDLVRMVVPDVEGRPVYANSPIRGSMSLEDRLQRDRAKYAEERARWFQAIGMADPAAQGGNYQM
jgi:chemotaxis protein histidine kinase CheA